MNKTINVESFLQMYNTQNQDLMQSFIKLKDDGFTHDGNEHMSIDEIDDIANLLTKLNDNLKHPQKNGFRLG